MTIARREYPTRRLTAAAAGALFLGLAACATPGPGEAPDGVYDPQEPANRRVHAFNKRLAEPLSGAGAGAGAVPGPVRQGVDNLADTLSLPQTVANQLLQGRLGRASRNSLRFTVNATLGLAGLFDVASGMGLPEDESDFGETLHVWGFPEGAYMELPVIGPSTERHAVGRFVDLFTDPVSLALPRPDRYYVTGVKVTDKALSLGKYGDSIDDVLSGSADSYAQLRLIYLQNRRFELGEDSGADESYIDPEAIDTEGF
ncbi:MlaA family lipoprotein [Salipiger mucosus]|uniref:Lipoprotein VacJ n=1 Tax=Salipiger mucosus DSM 16094 TaxID=1123237 RepID=S9R4Z8_9RHOB|nr:VacJ family lipoprotein [Salipiger mucosus]EPX86992.1 Lipoprotein VacJ [Salipiger mucosus DSM 16094]